MLDSGGCAFSELIAGPSTRATAWSSCCHDGKLTCLACGAVKLSPRSSMSARLSTIFDRLGAIIVEHQPDRVAIEDVFYALNVKSALKLGQVRGVAMLAASSAGLEVAEYSPLVHQVGGRRLRQGREAAGAAHGHAAAESGRDSRAAGRRRCPRDCDLPFAYFSYAGTPAGRGRLESTPGCFHSFAFFGIIPTGCFSASFNHSRDACCGWDVRSAVSYCPRRLSSPRPRSPLPVIFLVRSPITTSSPSPMTAALATTPTAS